MGDGSSRVAVAGVAAAVRGPSLLERWLRRGAERARLEDVALGVGDVIISAHACGALSDAVLSRAVAVGARVALLPCCHRTRWRPDLVDRADPAARIDEERAMWLVERGYDVIVVRFQRAPFDAATNAPTELV